MSLEQLSALAAKFRGLTKVGAAIAADAAPECLAIAKATVAAGTTPDGSPWAPRKSDGGRALVNAAAAITARAVGDVVWLVLSGVNVFHNKTRRILPSAGNLPEAYRVAIRKSAQRVIGGAV